MSYANEIYKVDWDSSAWERAVLERTDIARYGGPGDWVLYRPSRLLVRTSALEDKQVRKALTRAGADRSSEPGADIANALDFTLFLAPDDQLVKLVLRLRSYMACCASLDHVLIPGANRIHGDDLPKPTGDPGNIPGASGAGEGVTVLVLDTGFADPEPFDVTMDAADKEIPDEDLDGKRDHAAGHGTHIAGIVARYAPGAKIVARRLLTTPVGQASDLDVAAALLNHKGADLINCSFGSTTLNDAPPILIEAALAALPPTTIVVAAAGNAGVSRPNYPAASNRVIAVGAVGRPNNDGNWLQTSFSNHGLWVDACAPGVAVASRFLNRPQEGFHGFATWSGTSMAAPHVTGTIAALATNGQTVPQAATVVRSQPTIGAVGAFVNADQLLGN